MSNKTLTARVKLDAKQAERTLQRLEKRIRDVNRAANNQAKSVDTLNRSIQKAVNTTNKLNTATQKVANTTDKVNRNHAKSNKLLGSMVSKMKRLAGIYLGVMGARALFTTADNITSSENRLNNVNAQILGDDPSNGYSKSTVNATTEAMNKMYAASQRARTGYGEMMANVSKSMVLAGKAFGNNMDNAIAFQETMAKAYTVGGASAAEQASSMYQMIQALGSGILQGDELRSVREGAPLAYKAIEEFAQGVYNTEESLKELASQGKITSDIVVAAIANASESINSSFNASAMTWAQAWTYIKNVAIDAVRPIQDTLNEFISSDAAQVLLVGIESAIRLLGATINWVLSLLSSAITWVVDNWYWIQWIVYTGLVLLAWKVGALAKGFALLGAKAIWAGLQILRGLLISLGSIGWVILGIGAIITILVSLGVSVQQIVGFIVGVISAALSVIWNLFIALVTLIISGCIIPLTTAWDAFANFLGNVLNAPGTAMIRTMESVANAVLGILRNIATAIDAIFGTNLASGVSRWISGLSGKADALVKKYGNGNYEERSNVTGKVNDALNKIVTDVSWNTGSAFNSGYNLGSNAVNWIGSKLKLSNLTSKFMGKYGSESIGAYDPTVALNTTTPDSGALGNIADDTDKIADNMELAQEDLEYLRKLAQLEWKKEYTSNNININMTNNNNVNGESDLDGIVTKLTEKLYEELSTTASGVYA